jgi:DNA-directed RNA polymerase subunit M/transcription elongation factor TFIIS
MFITCPNCKELVKKGVGECPLCKYSITAEDIMKAEQEDKEKREQLESEKMEEYARRYKILLITNITFIVLFLAAIPLCLVFPHPYVAFVVMEVAVVVAAGIVFHKTKCGQCPYCNDTIISRDAWRADFCPRCGGRLR